MPEDNLDVTTPESDAAVLADESEESKPETETQVSEAEEVSEEEEKEEEVDDEPKSEDEEEEKLSEEDQEAESKITRPSWKELKDKYPGIEKNREFREIYFREKEYSELFPTVADAKEANDRASLFDYFNTELATGDPNVLLKSLNPEVVVQFAEKVLPSLYSHDQKLFVRATRPLLVDIINELYETSTRTGDENLKRSVLNICKPLFGDFKVPSRTTSVTSPEIEAERNRLRAEREQLFETQQTDFNSKAERSIHNQLLKTIKDGLNVDNEFLSESIISKTIDKVKATLNSDREFMSRMQSLMKQAERGGFTPEYVTRIVSAYLGRAKGIALKARAELKASALNKRSANAESKGTKRVEGTGKGNGEVGSTKKITSKANLKSTREVSDLDIINS